MFTNAACMGANRREIVRKERQEERCSIGAKMCRTYLLCQAGISGGDRALVLIPKIPESAGSDCHTHFSTMPRGCGRVRKYPSIFASFSNVLRTECTFP